MRPYAILVAVVPLALAAPAPAPQSDILTGLATGVVTAVANLGSVLDAIPAIITDLTGLQSAANEVTEAIANGTIQGTDVPAAVKSLYGAVTPTQTITSIPQATSVVAQQWGFQSGQAPTSQTSQSFLTNALGLVLNGFTSSDLTTILAGSSPSTNSFTNSNPDVYLPGEQATAQNKVTLYSANKNLAGSSDPSYSVSESSLRGAIYIPGGFDKTKKAVIMSPGTGATGGINFESNIGKLLTNDGFPNGFQPVYLNIPGNLLADAQVNAEYVAYAINYMYYYTGGQKVAVITWSQGSLDAQWAFKYWTSTPPKVQDHIAISPDYHGTVLAYLVCPGFAAGDAIACDPSVIQQDYNSNFVNKLRSNGGDTAYVNVTTVYSLTDEIVQPQEGTAASGFIAANTTRNAQSSNTYLQDACAGQPAGGLYTHEGVLYNPVAYALVKDALTNDGPGLFSRVSSACADIVAPGISLADVIETEALIPLALYNILAYTPRALTEPAIMSYATY